MAWDGQIKRLDTQYRATLRAILHRTTSAEASAALKIETSACLRRLTTLRKAGYAAHTGRNEQCRWHITPAGRAALESSEPIALRSRARVEAIRVTRTDRPPEPWSVLAEAFGMGSVPPQVSGRFVDRMGMAAEV